VSVALAVIGYGARACVPPKRRLGLLVLAAATLLFGLLARGSEDVAKVAVVDVTAFSLFSLVLPIGSLVVGDAVLGAEIRSGVFTFTWLSPARLGTILVGRWIAGTAVTVAVLAPAAAVAATAGGAPELSLPLALATAGGAACYLAVFLAIGATFRRAPAISLLYAFLIERLLGTALSAIAQVSPGWLAWSMLTGWVDGLPDDQIRDGVPQGSGAAVRLAIVTVVALALALRGLRRLRITGAGD
jgi:hypothetical protein